MATVSLREAKNKLTELARRVENGETVVVTRHGKPAFDLVPHRPKRGLDWEAVARWRANQGLPEVGPPIPDDFDDPLPEDFLLRPLP